MKTPVNPLKHQCPRACFSPCRRARPSASPQAPSGCSGTGIRAVSTACRTWPGAQPSLATPAVPGQGLGAGAAEGMSEIILNVAGDVFQTPHGFLEVMELKRRNLPLQKLLWGGSQKQSQGISPAGHVSEAGLSPRPALQQPGGHSGSRAPGQHQRAAPRAGDTRGRMLWFVSAGRPDKHGVRDGLGRLRN